MKNICSYYNTYKSENNHKKWVVLFCNATLAFLGFMLLPVNNFLNADTLNVPGDFPTIQTAVDSAFTGDTVKVAPGSYNESVVMKDGVNIEGAGRDATRIISSVSTVTITAAHNAVISGFLLQNPDPSGIGVLCDGIDCTVRDCRISDFGESGIACRNGGSQIIKNNIIDNNSKSSSFRAAAIDATLSTGAVTILNNSIFNNNENGIGVGQSTTIKNNLIYNNGEDGIEIRSLNSKHTVENNTIFGNSQGVNSASIDDLVILINNIIAFNKDIGVWGDSNAALSFNDVFGNGTDYRGLEPGSGDISEDPLFFDAPNGDFHFFAASPCIDAGNTVLTDPDGSRGDMGAYGGPGALENSTIFGPIVKDILVTPSAVRQGEPITIRANASVQ